MLARCTAARPAPAPSTRCCSRPSPRAGRQPERRYGARVFRAGDKVIQIRNNYDKGTAGVFNGTVGTITALSVTDQQLTRAHRRGRGHRLRLRRARRAAQHAYAITVHRSQGSEYPAVVVPLTMSAYTLLQRNLLYTAVTRAKRLVVLVGSRAALAIAVRTAGTGRRHTALTHRLQQRRARTVAAVSRPWDGQLQQVPVEPEDQPMAVAGHPRRMKMGWSSGQRRRSLGAASPLISLTWEPRAPRTVATSTRLRFPW